MSVIPLTLTISLCLVFTFLIFFIRESSRRRYSSAERNALLPLEEEIPHVVGPLPHNQLQNDHAGHECDCSTGKRKPRTS